MILDTHLHVWDPSVLDYGWLTPRLGRLHRRFDLDQARRSALAAPAASAAGGVAGVVLVQAADSLAETEFLLEQARALPGWVRGVVGWVPLRQPDRVRVLLEQGWAQPLCGVRHLTHDDPDPMFLSDPAVHDSLTLVAEAGLTLDIPDAYPAQLPQVPEVAAAVPELTIVVDHLGKPPIGADLSTWRGQLRALRELAQVNAKVSGLATSAVGDTPAGADALREVWDEALEVFGPHRLMFGSDWPIAPAPGDYEAGTAATLDLITELSGDERRQVLTGTAERSYGL